MKYWLKRVFIFSTIIFIVGIYATPVFAATEDYDTRCWSKSLCEQKKGIWTQTEESKKACDPVYQSLLKKDGDGIKSKIGDSLAYCLPQQAEVKLQVPIGGLTNTSTLLNYIPNLYTYAVSIVSIIAVIMIMVGGLRYLTAGGAQDKVTSAKNTILGAVVGLFLVFGANLLLRTVNPDLVTLKLPQITMIRTVDLLEDVATTVNNCKGITPSVIASGSCNNSCECKDGATCLSYSEGPLSDIIKTVGATAVTIGTLGAGQAIGTAAKGGLYVVRGSATVLKTVATKMPSFVVKHPIIAGGGSYLVLKGLGVIGGDSGIPNIKDGRCISVAIKNIEEGGYCAFDYNCKEGVCVSSDIMASFGKYEGSKGSGFCSSYKVGSVCSPINQLCQGTQLTCVKNWDKTNNGKCTDGKENSPCENNTQCDSNLICADNDRDGFTECSKGTNVYISYETTCGGTSDYQTCKQGQANQESWYCIRNRCTDGAYDDIIKIGGNCSPTTSGGSCNSELTCAFYSSSLKQWVEQTDKQNDYPTGTILRQEWGVAVNTPRANQCRPTGEVSTTKQ